MIWSSNSGITYAPVKWSANFNKLSIFTNVYDDNVAWTPMSTCLPDSRFLELLCYSACTAATLVILKL
jgi:hypothetical protein